MQVEPSSESAPADAAPTLAVTEATPEPAPMEVEPEPTVATPHISISAEAHEPTPTPADAPTSDSQPSPVTPSTPPTPEIDIPDASVEPEEAAPPVDIDVEPPSRAEPTSLDDDAVDITASSEAPVVNIEEAEEASTVSELDRASFPSLSDDLESADAEMDVEPQEAHTPPPEAHIPLVVVDSRALHDAVESVPVGGAPKRGASPLVDRSWDEFRAYDMF